MEKQPVKTLTIGGSDSGGAAGIQADLKTWSALGVYGMTAITAVTAQNSVSVDAVQFMPPALIAAQIAAVLADYGAQALKSGFLGQTEIIEQTAQSLHAARDIPLVVDPVLVNHRGQPMFAPEVTNAYQELLLPLAELITPNWQEALLLAGVEPSEEAGSEDLAELANRLASWGPANVLITGVPTGHDRVKDVWFDGRQLRTFEQLRIKTNNVHGSGDTLSAAVCAYLALGAEMASAIDGARSFTARALAASATWQVGRGHGPLAHFAAD